MKDFLLYCLYNVKIYKMILLCSFKMVQIIIWCKFLFTNASFICQTEHTRTTTCISLITYHFYALCVAMACFSDFSGLHCHVKCCGNEMYYCSCTVALIPIILPVPSKSVSKRKAESHNSYFEIKLQSWNKERSV